MRGDEAVPFWLSPEDHGWLRLLIDDFARLDGRPYREAAAFLREPPRSPAPGGKRRMAIWTLQGLCNRERPPIDAALFRDALVIEAQNARDRGTFARAEVIAACAQRFGLAAAAAEEHMFVDLPGERRLRVPEILPDTQSLASRTNLALAQGLLRLSCDVVLEVHGRARAIIRQVRLRRLLCTIRRAGVEGASINISGPFSLFRHTTMYGHALASILPLLPWCDRFHLAARCMLRGRRINLYLRTGDPIPAGEQPRMYDSRIEERFARDFARASLDWDLVREPEPVEAGGVLVFPDFAIVHRRDQARRFLLEIVGFWTPEYLREKLDRLRAAPPAPLVLCIDRGLNCAVDELPCHARVVWFQKRIDPQGVLAAIESGASKGVSRSERIGLADLYIDWAGRCPASHPVHRRLAALKPGAEVRLRRDGGSITIEAGDGPIAMLSRPGCARWADRLGRVVSASLAEAVERKAVQSAPEWRTQLRCDRWIVPVVDVVLESQQVSPEDECGRGST